MPAGSSSGRRTARGTSAPTAARCRSAAPRWAPRRTAPAPATATSTSPFPNDLRTTQLRRRGRLPDEQGDLRAALGLQQVRQRQRDAELDQPVLRQPAGRDYARAGQHVQQVHADRQLPRPAVALGDLGALHLGARPPATRPSRTTALNSATVPANNRTYPSAEHFNGENINQSFALSGRRTPMANVDSRVYYYWTKLQNNSDLVEYGNAPTQPLPSGLGCGTVGTPTVVGNCDNENFDYTKNNVGFDVWWRFSRGQKLGVGYDYMDLTQERFDYSGHQTQQVLRRVQEHDARQDHRPPQVPVHHARLGQQLQQRRRQPRTTRTTCIRTRRRSTCRAMTANQFKLNLDWNADAAAGPLVRGQLWSSRTSTTSPSAGPSPTARATTCPATGATRTS